MPKDQPVIVHSTATDSASLKTVERSLRMLTWQLFVLIALLIYVVVRPQAGRYQIVVSRDEVLVFDTVSRRAEIMEKRNMNPSPQPDPGTPATGENSPPSPPSAEK